jgi:hypothetical protein
MRAFGKAVATAWGTVDSGCNQNANVAIVCYVERLYSLIPEEALP